VGFSSFTSMPELTFLDWAIIIGSILVCFIPALFVGKRSGSSTAEFFASGRSVPWWLAGLSMVATTFSADTPNWVTEQVRRYGVAGNWQWWAFALTGIATVFFFARLWRRSGVMTDLEFYEHRYSGQAASVVRGFRAVYLGLFFNCFIMGMVTLAACKIANILFGLDPLYTILSMGVLNVVFAAHSGLWGVIIIDTIQFAIMMTAVFAAAWFALVAVAQKFAQTDSAWVGLQILVEKLSTLQVVDQKVGEINVPVVSAINGQGQPILDLLPNFAMSELALMIFILPIAISWWANWYPGAEPGGGSYIAQRMLASKSERDSLGGTLFFNLAHYVFRPWPWIISALCSILIFPDLASIQAAFPHADPKLIGHDSAYAAMMKFLPSGFFGLMIAGLIAATSSTILTHLNWGASYLVHDFYRRFMVKNGSESHYVNAGRACTVLIYVFAALLSFYMTSAQEAFQVLISIGAGTGMLYLARWFWWRVSAWCEVVAMVVSLVTSVGMKPFLVWLNASYGLGIATDFATVVMLQVGLTTFAWVLMAYVGPQTDHATLLSFVRKVKPAGPGWTALRAEAGITEEDTRDTNHTGLAFVGWVSGVLLIWSGLFALGNFLYAVGDSTRAPLAWASLAVLVVSGIVLLVVIKRLWAHTDGGPDSPATH